MEISEEKINEQAETADDLTGGEGEAEVESGVTSSGHSKRSTHLILAKKFGAGKALVKKLMAGKVLAKKKSASGGRSKRVLAHRLHHHHHHKGHSSRHGGGIPGVLAKKKLVTGKVLAKKNFVAGTVPVA